MSNATWYSVTVSRINEGMDDEPYETYLAHEVIVDQRGHLSIRLPRGNSRSLSGGLWDEVVIKCVAQPEGEGDA